METCLGDLEAVLVNTHVDDGYVTNIVVNFRAMYIGRDTLHSYMKLLSHLEAVNNTQGWDACQAQIKHHGEKMGLIRGKYRQRAQIVTKAYIYLRDGHAKNWMSLKIYHAELTSLRAQITHGGTKGSMQRYSCSQ